MKWNKILALLLVIAMAMTMLVACGGNDDDEDDDGKKSEASETVKDDDKGDKEEKEEEKAPKDLTEDYLVGTWVATFDGGKILEEEMGFEMELPFEFTLEFKENGDVTIEAKMDFDEDDVAKEMKKLFEDEDFLKDTVGLTKEEFDAALEQSGMDLDEMIAESVDEMDLSSFEDEMSGEGEWELEDGKLTVDGDEWPGEYKNGVLTMEIEDAGIDLSFEKK